MDSVLGVVAIGERRRAAGNRQRRRHCTDADEALSLLDHLWHLLVSIHDARADWRRRRPAFNWTLVLGPAGRGWPCCEVDVGPSVLSHTVRVWRAIPRLTRSWKSGNT